MTDQPTPETDAKLAAATEDSSATHSPPSDWPEYARALKIQRNAARAERDALRADVARLRTALEGMLIAEMAARKSEGWTRSEVEPEPHWMAARAALAALAK
jgi:hypothetical protein